MPDEMEYDEARRRLLVGKGFIENVPPAVWNYEVSGKRVLTQWSVYDEEHVRMEWEEKRRKWELAQRLKSKDPLPAARALEVPPSWRKSLHAGVNREHLPLFPDDDDTVPTKREPTPCDPDGDEPSEKLP